MGWVWDWCDASVDKEMANKSVNLKRNEFSPRIWMSILNFIFSILILKPIEITESFE